MKPVSVDDREQRRESFDLWKLSEELSIKDAALIINWHLPEDYEFVEDWEQVEQPYGYMATKKAICGALRLGRIKAGHTEWLIETVEDSYGEPYPQSDIGNFNIETSTVLVDSLINWLTKRGHISNPFCDVKYKQQDYLDKENPRYTLKLAAAVSAWTAYETVEHKHQSPKQNLITWLRFHAIEYGLVDEQGKCRETVIEEIAKIANWATSGGAPKSVDEKTVGVQDKPEEGFADELNDEIPF